MLKVVNFIEKDRELIQQIEAFRKAQQLPSFIEAVRRLCMYGLSMSDVAKNLK